MQEDKHEREILELNIAYILYKIFSLTPDGLMLWNGGFKAKDTCKNLYQVKNEHRGLEVYNFQEVLNILKRLEKTGIIKKMNPTTLGFNYIKNSVTYLVSESDRFEKQKELVFQTIMLYEQEKNLVDQEKLPEKFSEEKTFSEENPKEKGGELEMAEENYSNEVIAQANDLFAEYMAGKFESLAARCKKLFAICRENGLKMEEEEVVEENQNTDNPAQKLASRWIARFEAKVGALSEERKKKNEKKYKK